MTRKLLSLDEFRTSVSEGERPEGTVLRLSTGPAEVVAGVDRTLRFVFSDGTVDRAGDSIDPKGWELEQFSKNPVALFAHDASSPPIGRAVNVGAVGGKLMGDIEFMPREMSEFADSIYQMVKAGYIRAVSVGFLPLEYSFVSEKDRPFGIDFKRQELLEISVCPVPCNPNALSEARAKGIDTAPLCEWAAKVLDTGGVVLVPRAVLEETFKAAKTPHATRRQYLERATPEQPEPPAEPVEPAEPVAEPEPPVVTEPGEPAVPVTASTDATVAKAGRRISAANIDRLTKAVEHIQSVIGSNEPDDDDKDPSAGDAPPLEFMSLRERAKQTLADCRAAQSNDLTT